MPCNAHNHGIGGLAFSEFRNCVVPEVVESEGGQARSLSHAPPRDPRKNVLLQSGNKSDRIDARKLAELLRNGSLSAVYHGERGIRTLRELVRSYLTISKDRTRVMNRLKALYRSWGIACSGTRVYAPRHRSDWLSRIPEAGVRCRAEFIYQQLDGLQALHQRVRRELLAESRKYPATKLLRRIPSITWIVWKKGARFDAEHLKSQAA